MPLIKSPSKAAVGKNIAREEAAGRPRKQAIAIALDVQRRAGGGNAYAKRYDAAKGGR
jgi:hypothetical protein